MVETVINPNDGFVSIIATGGETDLDFDFPIYEKSHLRIIRARSGTDTDLVLNTDYTIADDQLEVTAGGTAVLSVAATAADVYSLLLDVPEGRTTDFNQAGDFKASTVNRELDLQTQMIQGLRRDVDKSARLSDDSTLTSLTLPDPEANKLIGWNSGATGLENKVVTDASTITISAFMGTLLDDSTASEARITLGITQTNLGISAFAQTLLDDATAAAARTTLDAERMASALTGVSPATGDYVIISDASDSNSSKKALLSDVIALNPVALSKSYASSGQTITSAGLLTLAHGMGIVPKIIQLSVVCTSTDAGWAVNDEVFINPNIGQSSADSDGASVYFDATNIYVRYGSSATTFRTFHKTTGSLTNLDNTKWQFKVRAFA